MIKPWTPNQSQARWHLRLAEEALTAADNQELPDQSDQYANRATGHALTAIGFLLMDRTLPEPDPGEEVSSDTP